MENKKKLSLSVILLALASVSSFAEEGSQTISKLEKCLLTALRTAEENVTVKSVREQCEQNIVKQSVMTPPVIHERIMAERQEAFDPYVIVPHKMNYILPASYTDNLNREMYNGEGTWSDSLQDVEAKFQISIKVPLIANILNEGDQIAFGFTLQSWWQLYAGEVSSPFRETNYQPEIFYFTPLNWHPFEGHTGVMVGLEHQSNGRSNSISRSWNRAYVNMFYAKNNFIASFRPWYRIPENAEPSTPGSPGDDNHDIEDYMGHFELTLAYKWDDYEVVYMGRRNFEEGNGGMELGFTFPLTGRLKGYLQYTNGFGESLIDYNHSQQRFGVGIAMTDLF